MIRPAAALALLLSLALQPPAAVAASSGKKHPRRHLAHKSTHLSGNGFDFLAQKRARERSEAEHRRRNAAATPHPKKKTTP